MPGMSKHICTNCLKTVASPRGFSFKDVWSGTCGCDNPSNLHINHQTRTPSPSASKHEWADFVVYMIRPEFWWRFHTLHNQIVSRSKHLDTSYWRRFKQPVAKVENGTLNVYVTGRFGHRILLPKF